MKYRLEEELTHFDIYEIRGEYTVLTIWWNHDCQSDCFLPYKEARDIAELILARMNTVCNRNE